MGGVGTVGTAGIIKPGRVYRVLLWIYIYWVCGSTADDFTGYSCQP